jgi:hypothetical protein
MCSVACRNYSQFHLRIYGSSNSVLFVLNSLEMHVIYICLFLSGISRPIGGWGCYKLVSQLVYKRQGISQ